MKKEVITRLRQILGAPAVTEDETDLLVYECDALTLFKNKPDVVVFPQTTEQVAQIVRVANEYRIPFVPRGAGTGLSGGAVAMEGGMIIELQRMNRILSIDPDNRIAVVQPGVVNIFTSRRQLRRMASTTRPTLRARWRAALEATFPKTPAARIV